MYRKSLPFMVLLCALLVAVLGSSTRAASVSIYTDRAAWEAAVGSFAEEQFEDQFLNPGVSVVTDAGYVHLANQNWSDRPDSDGTYITTFSFSNAISAFGGNWDLSPSGAGVGLKLSLDGTPVGTEIPSIFTGGFWGVVSTGSFNHVLIEGGTQLPTSGRETYTLDNMVYSAAPSTVIPLPAAVWPGLALLAGLSLRRRR